MNGLWRGVLLAWAVCMAAEARAADCVPDGLAYVGTEGGGIQALRFDACTGRLAAIGQVADASKVRWIVAHPKLPVVYAAVDTGAGEGRVAAFAVDRKSGALSAVNETGAGGSGTTHLWLDAASSTLLAANFGSGSVASIAVRPDGSLGERLSDVQDTGTGPHRRQASAHAHGSEVDPSGRHALVPDLGADRVFIYAFDRATGKLSPGDAQPFATDAGSGPRRAVFAPDGRFIYVLGELDATVRVLRWDAQAGRLAPAQALPVSSPVFQGTKSASEVAVSRDGRFVYVADRGEDALVAYRVDPETGALGWLQRLPSGGEAPWAFAIDPSGRWMLVANYRGKRVNLFGIDAQTGRLADTGQSVEVSGPLSLSFLD